MTGIEANTKHPRRRSTDRPGDTDSTTTVRQQRVRELHACEAVNTQPAAPIATAWLSVLPDGRIRTTALNVEPDQVPALLAAMDALRADLERFVAKSKRTAKVIPFRIG